MVAATFDTDTTQAAPARGGSFLGTDVRTGTGGGLASSPPTPSGATTHYHAARLPQLGDVVLAVARIFDPRTAAALRIELRAFAASAQGRGALATMGASHFVDAPGSLAFASIELSAPGDAADERRPATLRRCIVTDAAPTVAAARGVADWLRATWETELAFGSWPAIIGTLDAFAVEGGVPSDWAHAWLAAAEHRIDETSTPHSFLKVLSDAWLEDGGPAATAEHAATATP